MSRRRSAAGGPGSLPLLPRLGKCSQQPSAALFIDVRAPPSPHTSQWERPPCSPSANGRAPPRNPARACQQQLRPSRDSPSPFRAGRPLAELGGSAGRDPPAVPGRRRGGGGSGPQGPPAPLLPAPLLPALTAAGPRKPSPTLPSARGSPCAGTVLGAVAPPLPQSAGRHWGHLAPR